MDSRTAMKGSLTRVAGPTVVASGMSAVGLYHRVRVGRLGLLGEVIRLDRDQATIQVYEDTSGLQVGEPAPQNQNGED